MANGFLKARVIVSAFAIALFGAGWFLLSDDDEQRVDDCIGATEPVQRGKLLNRCDHAISVLVCPLEAQNGTCVVSAVEPDGTFDVPDHIKTVIHACRAPQVASAEEDGTRRCQMPG